MRNLWIGNSLHHDPAVQELLDAARERPLHPLAGRELRVELAFGALFVAVAAWMLLAFEAPRPLGVLTAVGLTLLYAIASRVEFESGVGATVPTQLVLVPMLFLLPTQAVPLFVAAGLLLGRAPSYLSGSTPANRAIVELGDALYSVGPAIVLLLAGAGEPQLGDWPVYGLALLAQFAGDTAISTARSRLGLGVSPGIAVRELVSICVVDALLAAVGLLAALASATHDHAYGLLLPLFAMLAVSARNRRLRIEQSFELWRAYRGSALLLERVIAADDRRTGEHGRGVGELALHVGAELGLEAQDRIELEFAALLHDVGKIAVDNEIINKRGPLNQDEFTAIKTHTIEGHRMLEEVGGLLGRVGAIVRSCHERWDGAGYPDGLAGEAIPLPARVVFACDAYHAMTTDRSYRSAWSPERAISELQANAGSQFDPEVVAALVRVLECKGAMSAGRPAQVPAPSSVRAEPPAMRSDEGVLGLNRDGTLNAMNSAAVRLLGWSPEEAIGRHVHDLLQPIYPNGRPYAGADSPIQAALQAGREQKGRVDIFLRKDGTPLGVSYALWPESEQGAVLEFKPMVVRSPAEQALRLGEELYRSLARNLPCSTVMLFDQDFRLLVVEGERLAQAKLEREALLQHRLGDVLPPEAWEALREPVHAALAGERTEVEWLSREGGRSYRATIGPIRDDQGAVQAGLAVAEDVTQSRHRAERLDRLAHYDELTGLSNRAAFHEQADKALRRARRAPTRSALLFIDLDGLKAVNDTRGHEAGDELLRQIANRLAEAVREVDTVARLSGDEFAVLLADVGDPSEVAVAAERILRAVATPVPIGGDHEAQITASIGIAIQSSADETAAQLLRAADAAMYHAKGLGGDRVEFYTAAPELSFKARLHAGQELARALERDELALVYQPEVDLAHGGVVAVEALVRWQHPERGLLEPRFFLPEAERHGLLAAIDDWVMRRACEQAVAWEREGLPPFRVAVNLSDAQLRRAGLQQVLGRRLREAGMAPERLELEVAERQLEDGEHPVEESLRDLRSSGARVVIDRFGSGRSALGRLPTFPVDALKLDPGLVRELPAGHGMAAGLIDLGHVLGLEVMAGGVETDGQLEALRSSGCDIASGRVISAPMPAGELTPWLVSRFRRTA